MSANSKPPSISHAAFAAAKAEYAAALNGMCETCHRETTRVNVAYRPPPGETDFDPEYFIARCQSCARRGRTELVKVRLADQRQDTDTITPIRQRETITRRAAQLCDGCGCYLKQDQRWNWGGNTCCSQTCLEDVQRWNRWTKTAIA
ncbi:hypothetical protein [Ruegeria arenilitoris]|uniref:hypothetical protein n=1 Tax=Ruegeria arenilitoris TaxID=1173585 RepID=UPI0014809450|nr:hypothetical protein [Ruegeria arenilitoris]